MSQTKTALVTFYTEGAPSDKGKNLSASAKTIKESYEHLFDHIFLFNPYLLDQYDKGWNEIIYSQHCLTTHLRSDQRKDSLNIDWINLNCLLWKPALMSALLAKDSGIEEGTIIVYHDVNIHKYPVYNLNFSNASSFFEKKLSRHSVALIVDSLFPLYADCKQEVINSYLHSKGRTFIHRWAGCFAMKKNNYSREFCRDWYNLTAIEKNRSQLTTYATYPGFIWHSPEQATLSIIYYLWKYSSGRRAHINSIFTPHGRDIAKRWGVKDVGEFFLQSAKIHKQSFFKASLYERIMIMFRGKKMLESLPDASNTIPNIYI